MSKRIDATIKCQSCGLNFPVQLYRSIWIEIPSNRSLIHQDKINRFSCPSCTNEVNANFPFLATNATRGIAVWYEPYHDPQIDEDTAAYKKHMGEKSFYAQALRISDWSEFKGKLIELEKHNANTARDSNLSKATSNNISRFIDGLKASPNSAAKKRTLALAIAWCVLSIPISDAVYDVWEYRNGSSTLMRLFWLIMVAAPVWMLYGWRWITDNSPIGPKVWGPVLVAGFLVLFPLLESRSNYSGGGWSNVAAVPLLVAVAFVVLAWSLDRRSVFRRHRRK